MEMKTILKKAVVLLTTLILVSSTLVVANTVTEPKAEPEYKEIWLGYDDFESLERGEEWFQYDDGVPEYVIGWSTVPLIAKFAIRLTNEELAAYDGCKIIATEWYHAVTNDSIPQHDYDIMIYEGNETLPLVEMVNESNVAIDEGYAYHEFTAEYIIDASKDIWIVCRPYLFDAVAFYDYPVGWDNNQASWYPGRSSWRYNLAVGGWYEYHPLGLNGSWCLHVKIQVPDPDLDCEGELSWEKIKPGATVYGEFDVKNIGEEGSLLKWEVASNPDWGNWTFTPSAGTGVAAGDSVTINVTVVAPAEKKQEFTGKVKIVNLDDASDFCEIDVILKTPLSSNLYIPSFMAKLFERFPNAFPLLRHLLGY